MRMLVVEAKGDPNVAGKDAFGLLFKTFFGLPGARIIGAPRGRWANIATDHPLPGQEEVIRRSFCCAAAIAALLLAGGMSRGPGPEKARGEFVFPLEGRPTPQCHAATVVELAGGTIAAAWFGGEREGAADVGIWLARREKDGWTRPEEIAAGAPSAGSAGAKRHPCWNPVLHQADGGPLLLFYKVGPSPAAWWGMMKTSPDGGRTWSPASRLPVGILGPIKNKPFALSGGVLLCPSSTEDRGWKSHFEWTPDLGKTWSRSADLAAGSGTIEAIQPCLLIHPGGKLQALGRSRQGRIFESWSGDGGKTWAPMRLTSLPNPNSGIDAATLRDGRHILIYNPVERGRTPLVVALSKNGADWETIATLEDEPGEYSYPAVIQGGDGRVHVVYTWRREAIKYAVLEVF